MAVCLLCGGGKAKRFCPSLADNICSLCCGRKRKVEIKCPQDGPFLVKGEIY